MIQTGTAIEGVPSIPTKLDIWAILILLGIIQGIILSFFFLTRKKEKSSSNRLLGFFMIVLSAPENANLKLEEIAEMVGYNSKSAFNIAFKKQTGVTPSEFRELKTGTASKV